MTIATVMIVQALMTVTAPMMTEKATSVRNIAKEAIGKRVLGIIAMKTQIVVTAEMVERGHLSTIERRKIKSGKGPMMGAAVVIVIG